ncbi:DUF1161 domain-containing protein [Variovorax sp. Root411]|uniref:DUF1161 domain-containing protein n=1 Tax=Variovorax sp. Root411 TaxID=1736530 RepID=UPI0006F82080|nr:DUF1161 domain-containing protein [Variovorax sp. Root411]KQW64310.1 hypothetical protein ASC92_02360 [Variovorax sp. Root411]
MKPWLTMLPAALALLAGAAAAQGAEDCEALRTRIESKIAAAGVARFTVTVVDANASANGQVVGSCELGSKKIVYLKDVGPGPASGSGSAPAPTPGEPMLTECKDGTVSVGGDCRK